MPHPHATLSLLATSDLHMHILPYDYFTCQITPRRGLLALKPRIDADRADPRSTTLLFDNGDFLQGTPLADALANEQPMPHPVATIMNALRYDAITLGNHEFNYGLAYLDDVLQQINCPVVCANIHRKTPPAIERPYVILHRMMLCSDGTKRPVKIGVIGTVTPQTTLWDHATLGDAVTSRDIVRTNQRLIPQIKAEGADVIVALCHSGIGSAVWADGMENAIVPLTEIDGIDAIIAGHIHQVFPAKGTDSGLINGVPVVMPGAFGQYIGRIELTLSWHQNTWGITAHQVAVLPAADPPADPVLSGIIAPAHHRTLTLQDEHIGTTDRALSTHFAQIAPNAAMDTLAHAMIATINTEAIPDHLRALPIIAAVSPSVAGGQGGADHYVNVAAGPVTGGDIAAIYPYPNQICAMVVQGRDVLNWLERAAACYHVLAPQQRQQPLIRVDMAPYQYDTIMGLQYEIDLCAPAQRIRNLRHNGQPVAMTDRFVMVTNSYRAYGGGDFTDPQRTPIVATTRATVRDALEVWFSTPQPHTPPSRWSLTAPKGTQAQFATSPDATIPPDGPHLHAGGIDAAGFREFTLIL